MKSTESRGKKCLRVESNNLKAMKRGKFCVCDKASESKRWKNITCASEIRKNFYPDKIGDKRKQLFSLSVAAMFRFVSWYSGKKFQWNFVYPLGFCTLRCFETITVSLRFRVLPVQVYVVKCRRKIERNVKLSFRLKITVFRVNHDSKVSLFLIS